MPIEYKPGYDIADVSEEHYHLITRALRDFEPVLLNVTEFRQLDAVVYVNRRNPGRPLSGFTYNGCEMTVIVDPEYPEYLNPKSKILQQIFAHEAHHVLRWRGRDHSGTFGTLGRACVSEGLAQLFEVELIGSTALDSRTRDPSVLKIHERAMAGRLMQENTAHWDYFGHEGRAGFPPYFGYHFGYALMSAGLKYRGLTAAQAVNRRAEYFIAPYLRGEFSLASEEPQLPNDTKRPNLRQWPQPS